MKVARPNTILLRLILPIIFAATGAILLLSGFAVETARAAPVSLRVVPPYGGSPNAITKLDAQPDFETTPESEGRIKLQWTSPSDGGGLDVFSYIIKYATFSVADLSGNTTYWWNHPNTLTAFESELPPHWGRKSYAKANTAETIVISGLSPGDYYYFAVKSLDRYYRASPWDKSFDSVTHQANAFATTPPWQPYIVTNLAAWAMVDLKASAFLSWTAPYFVDDKPPYNLVPGHIKQTGYYCIQYSTVPPTAQLNRPHQPINWEASTRIFISTRDVKTGDIQNYILTGLTHNTTYYIHIFTRNEWPNKWSYASHPVVSVKPYISLKPVENLLATSGASTDENIASYSTLSWRAPDDEKFLKGTRIVYSTQSYPASPSDGEGYFDVEPLLNAETTSYMHVRLLPRTTYYYGLWNYDINRFYSPPKYVSVYTADDLTPPPPVINITSTITLDQSGPSDLYHIRLNWDVATAPLYRTIDYKGVKIYYSSYTADISLHQYLTYKENSETSAIQTVLEPYLTYYYSIASYDTVGNEQTPPSRATHAVYISEKYVPPAPPTAIAHIYSVSRDYEEGCKLSLNWRAPTDAHTSRIVIRIGYMGYPTNIYDGDALGEWQVVPGFETNSIFNRLVSLTTNYVSIFAVSSYNVASRPSRVKFFTHIPWLDTTPPFAPRDLRVSQISGGKIRLSWSEVKYDANLKAISSPQTPKIDELYFYEVLTSTSIRGTWRISSREKPPKSYCDLSVPTDKNLFIKIRAVDANRNCAESAITDTLGNTYIANVSSVNPRDVDYVLIPSNLASVLRQSESPDKDAYMLTLSRVPSDEKGNIYKSIELKALRIEETSGELTLKQSQEFSLKGAGGVVAFSIPTENSSNNNSTISRQSNKLQSPEDAAKYLGVFYLNGDQWQRINLLRADSDGFVISPVRFAGKYQLRYAPASGEFVFYDVMPKIITPNNDGKNDKALFRFSNPQSAKISLKIYDINSVLVRNIGEITLTSDIQGEYIYWDGSDDKGRIVQPGVYVYQLELDGKVINGTIVVAR